MTAPSSGVAPLLDLIEATRLAGFVAGRGAALGHALERGATAADAARDAGMDPRVVAALAAAPVQDAPLALRGLVACAARADGAARRLQAAALTPLLLAPSVALAGVVVLGLALPALQAMPDGADLIFGPPAAAIGLAVAALVAMAVAVRRGAALPGLDGGWRAIEVLAALEACQSLTAAGAGLPDALRGAAALTRPPARAGLTELARALESGEDRPPGGAALHPMEVAILVATAQQGVVEAGLDALCTRRRAATSRSLPAHIARVHAASLAVGGAAVLLLGVCWIEVYAHALL